jgi:hypothetical protein
MATRAEGVQFDGLRPDLDGNLDKELHALIERAHQIEMLTQHPGWPLFSDYIIGLTTSIQNLILSGGCKTLEEYRERTGYVRGLHAAVQAPSVLLRRVAEMQAERETR